MRRGGAILVLPLLLAAAGCERVVAGLDLERMIDQPRAEPYGVCPELPEGRCSRPPPPCTVPWAQPLAAEEAASRPAATRALLERGRDRFDVYCAACHGRLGDGDSQVARFMTLRRPPSLHEPRIAALPADRLYRVVSEGWGMMPGYARALAGVDRWAIVAYLPALRRASGTRLDDLPPRMRREAMEALR